MATQTTPPIRVMLVDDHRLVLEGIRTVLGNGSLIDVVGEAQDLEKALVMISAQKPDMVLLDVEIGKVSTLERLEDIRAACPSSRILFLTGEMNEAMNERALIGGAHGLVLKECSSEVLRTAVKKVHNGEIWFDRKLTSRVLSDARKREKGDHEDQEKIHSLTKRELEVTRLIATGLVNKNIAERLFISEKTVRNHLTVIYSKIGVQNRLELALFASKNRLST
jgi:DNA-binding NarL/FixJ family response regulator